VGKVTTVGGPRGSRRGDAAVSGLVRQAVLAYSVRNRRRKAGMIRRFADQHDVRTVAVVGAIGSASQRNESIVEGEVASHARLVAALDIMVADVPWPYVVGDGRALPWRDRGVDLVIANAVIEHVGDESDQRTFMAEHERVATCFVVTTPNRWFPIESHTSAILRHWSPRWRATRSEFTRLLSRREFRELLPAGAVVVGRPWSPTFVAFWSAR
jgi:hypothetical protein